MNSLSGRRQDQPSDLKRMSQPNEKVLGGSGARYQSAAQPGLCGLQFSEGLWTLSSTTPSSGARAPSSRNPSCSCKALKTVGPLSSRGGGGGPPGFGPNGLGAASAPGTHSSFISNRPDSPVLSTTGRSTS